MHLDLPTSQQLQASSLEMEPIVSPTRKNLAVKLSYTSTSSLLDGQRVARLSSLSSSYAQFLKQRDMDKNKKVVRFDRIYLFMSRIVVKLCGSVFVSSYHKKIIVCYYHPVNG